MGNGCDGRLFRDCASTITKSSYYYSFSVKILSRAVREDRLTGFFETWNLSTLGTEVVFFSNLGDTGALGVGQGEIIH